MDDGEISASNTTGEKHEANKAVLHEFLKGTKKKDKSKIPWTKEAKEKFAQCEKDLANATLLTFPNLDSPLALVTDASDQAIGSILQQFEEDSWKPLAFFSKKLTNAQEGYSTYDITPQHTPELGA
ncbi:hypothetical protein AVEN_175647-1 [Araneus ventricosus]|uniref:Reverse transcriptase/retrotransposon-derived protein RNase H-like domain-containing protein n=1 Tax=Araneus ventricosus TaxID=182803 RepID=A0A4Y2QP09_ARAVE|nr:hypothetical protein AVEN_175647-1 [Araneus ventricosus]